MPQKLQHGFTHAPVSHEQKRAAIEREIAMRRKVYPQRVERGTMTEDEAAWELEAMLAVADDYERPTELPEGLDALRYIAGKHHGGRFQPLAATLAPTPFLCRLLAEEQFLTAWENLEKHTGLVVAEVRLTSASAGRDAATTQTKAA